MTPLLAMNSRRLRRLFLGCKKRKIIRWWKRHAEALECGGIYPRDTARGSALCAAPRRSPLLVRALSARHQKDKTQRMRLGLVPAGLPLPARNLPNARALPRPTDCLRQFLAKKDRISGLVIYRFCGYVVHSLSHAREERHQKAGQ
ncbi:hypothetical protein VCSRO87_2109 [Vibrio cholerae]|nr:hypothetical protein VCSRO87_2109 [Vibrio cholerae]